MKRQRFRYLRQHRHANLYKLKQFGTVSSLISRHNAEVRSTHLSFSYINNFSFPYCISFHSLKLVRRYG